MKQKLAIALVALGIGVALGWWFARRHDARPKPAVAIQDGKTIDFSSGKPVIKDDPAEKKIIADAVAEMDAASRNVTFPPPADPAQPKPSPPPREPAKTP